MRPMQTDLNFFVVLYVDDYQNDNLVKNFHFSFLQFYCDVTLLLSCSFCLFMIQLIMLSVTRAISELWAYKRREKHCLVKIQILSLHVSEWTEGKRETNLVQDKRSPC
jgi:hypothetical protein